MFFRWKKRDRSKSGLKLFSFNGLVLLKASETAPRQCETGEIAAKCIRIIHMRRAWRSADELSERVLFDFDDGCELSLIK